MRKRLSSKLLAVILTIAICATTVLGCLMTVGAASSCYSFGESKFNGDDLTQATIDVTFTAPDSLPNGFVSGAFAFSEVNADGEDYLIFKDVTSNDVNVSVEDNYVIFDGEAVKTAKFTFTVGFSTGVATDKTYQIALSEVELAYNDAEYYVETVTGTAGEITAACKHEITVVGDPYATNTANDYSTYKESVCSKCGETFGYQLVPTADKNTLVYGDEAAPVGTIDLLEFGSYLTDAGSTSTYYDTNVADNGETGSSWDDPIIIDSAEEFVYIAKTGTNDTDGKYYKVADGIAGFDLSGGKITDYDDTLENQLTNIQSSSKNHAGATPGFQGHFDGNGITVYGAWTNHTEGNISGYAGLFSCTYGDVTIKNVNVKLASFTAKSAAGGIVGYHKADDATSTLTIENCSVTDSHIETTGTGWGTGVGAIIGYGASAPSHADTDDIDGDGNTTETVYENVPYIIKNCYVNLDENYFTSPAEDGTEVTNERVCHGGVAGVLGSNALSVSNCVVIGITPYATSESSAYNDVQHSGLPNHFSNVYTTSDVAITGVKLGGTLAAQDFTGRIIPVVNLKGSAAVTAMSALDWGNTWVMDGTDTYPRLVKPGETFDTIYWDGTTASSIAEGSGAKDDPYIINTAAELAYLIGLKAETAGVYYKVADGIKNIVLQSYACGNDIMALDSASAVKTYFESGTYTEWVEKGWEQSSFCGTFDGNGATVYGLYMVSASNAGLFSTVDAGATIKNIAVKNSYMVSQSSGANYQVGAIAAVASSDDYGVKAQGVFWFNNCTVANCYMYNNCTGDRSGVIFGCANYDVACIDNCLVYGNDATYGDSKVMGLTGLSKNNLTAEGAPVPEGLTTVLNGTFINPMVRNSIVLGNNVMNVNTGYGYRKNSPDCFVNVYTDGASGTVNFTSGSFTYNDNQIKGIKASDAQGSGAAAAMPGLAWGTDWYCSAEGNYPVQAVFATLGTSGVSSADLELVAHNTTYNDDGSVNLNFHFVPKTSGATPVLYVGTLDGSKFMKLEATTSSQTATLGADALMYTIPNLSARDIDLIWLPTLVLDGSALKEWGKSEQLALADNARAILAGDYDTADKNVAAALLKYGEASDTALNASTLDYDAGTIDLLEFGDYLINDLGSTSKWYDNKLADNGETGADWDNAIIIDTAEEFVYLAKASGNDTAGLYYKVADGIAGFDLSGGKITDYDDTLENQLTNIQSSSKNHAGATPGFQGHFDGNGITVYGAWTNHTSISPYVGLFSCVKGDVTIKNVNVKLASFTGKNGVGGIVGYHKRADDGVSTLTIENCSITDSHLELTSTGGWLQGIGAIVGLSDNCTSFVDTEDTDGDNNTTETIYVNGPVIVKNCYVELDEEYFISNFKPGVQTDSTLRGIHGGVAGSMNTSGLAVSNCIVIGVTPYATTSDTTNNDVQHSGLETHFTNVYTDQPTGKLNIGKYTGRDFTGKVFQLTDAQLTGLTADVNMPSLDWNNVWTTTNGYPTFINKNYTTPASGYSIYWDGTTASSISEGSGTKDDPYIINTAAELAYVVSQSAANYTVTDGKYFKVADGITIIVLQDESKAADIMALDSAAETKAYFESASGLHTWKIGGWEGSTFCGNIDFNGATVYGLYIKDSASNAGLFSNVEAGAVIQNLAIKNSYMTSAAGNYQVAAVAAVSNGAGYAKKTSGIVWINNVTVANNYLYNSSTSHDRSGVLVGASSEAVYTDNVLIYGNDATYGAGVQMPLIALTANAIPETAAVPEGLVTKFSGTNSSGYKLHVCAVRNSIILGTTPYDPGQGNGSRFNDLNNCYENVYTDADLVNDTFSNGTSVSTIKGATQVTDLTTLKGDAAQSVVDTFNTANGSTVWYVGAAGDYPGFEEAGDMPLSAQTLYNGMVLDMYDDYGDSVASFGMYAPGLNLKVNPYMTFTFEFGGEYKQSDKVVVTFKSGDTVIETVTAADMINNENAGRFHLYRLKSAPVTAVATGISVSVSVDGGAAVDFGTYSAEGFALRAENANKVQPCDYYATRYEAAKALLFYAQMLDARYGA